MAAGTLMSATGFTAFFKNRYPQKKLDNLVKFEKPTLSAIKKEKGLSGTATYIPVELDSPQGISAHLGAARTNVTGSIGKAWAITPASLYAALTIDAKTMLASESKEGAFFKAREHEFERIVEQIGQKNESDLWSTGSGSLGILTAETANTFTVDAASAINFHEGMKLDFFDETAGNDLDTTDPHNTAVGYTVAGVNYTTGVITITETIEADVVVGDHVARQGTAGLGFVGIPGWITAADPTDTLFGVARTAYPQKLGGWRQGWLGTIEETAKALDATMRTFNQKGRTLWLSYANFNRLDIELGARGYRKEEGGKGVFGRVELQMSTPGGGVTVKAAPYLGDDAGYLLDMDSWCLMHLGGFPHLVQDDGLAATRLNPSAVVTGDANEGDGIEIRLRQFSQLFCKNPFSNGRITIE